VTYLICTGVLVLLYFALALNVSRMRGATKTGIGSGDDPSGPLNKAVRAHGNAAEYIPIFVALFLYCVTIGTGRWLEWVAIVITVCRILQAMGMLMTKTFNAPPHPLRSIGMIGTYAGGFAFGTALILRAVL
jgi:uncharacterized membrane protein YecN with MAPEG domain